MTISESYDDTNIFARIIRGDAPAARVYESESVLAFMDVFPQSEGHVLVIPKGNARNILDIDPQSLDDLTRIVQRIAKALYASLRPDGILVLQATGAVAGQTVAHLHFHVIPCRTGQPLKGHGHGQMADMTDLLKLAYVIASHLDDPCIP
jgi:histidine triad (HIT) family protein